MCVCVPGCKGERIKTDGGGAGERENKREEEIKSVCLQNESKGLLYLRWSTREAERGRGDNEAMN